LPAAKSLTQAHESMDTERYWIHIHILIHKWSWYRGGTCCIIFTSSETGESRSRKSAACPKWEGEQRNSPRRKGLANCWLAGVRVRDENGCSVGRQPDLRLDQHRAAKPAGYTTLTHTYIYIPYIRDIWRRWAARFPRRRERVFRFRFRLWGACRPSRGIAV